MAPRTLSSLTLLTPAGKREVARRLVAWYRRHRRDLPWRNSPDPYRVWISEVMLQQTQVATVVPYFERFLAEFPTVAHLAAADEEQVLRLWEGLGYYRRARQMHRAAQTIVGEHDGRFPESLEAIGNLPGIGRYTAGAIFSIALNRPAPIVEANTARLYSRLAGLREPVGSSAGAKRLWQLAEQLIPQRNCGTFNQALMELGALVCTPRAPRCPECPLVSLCAAHASGKPEKFPGPAAKPVFESVREAAIVVTRSDGRILVRRRPATERWAGLWDFLRFPLSAEQPAAIYREIELAVRQASGLAVEEPQPIATLKHGVTRFRITLACYRVAVSAGPIRLPAGDWKWLAPTELADLPMSTTGRKLSRILCQ